VGKVTVIAGTQGQSLKPRLQPGVIQRQLNTTHHDIKLTSCRITF